MASKPTPAAQILTAVLTAAAAWGAQKALRSVWERNLGRAPRSAVDPEVSAVAAVAFAGIAAVIGALAQRAATRGAERFAARLTDR